MMAVMAQATARDRASAKLTPQLQQLFEGAHNHGGIAAGRLAGLTRKMMDADFRHGRAQLSCARQYLDIDQRTRAAKLRKQPLEQVAAIELEAAIDVAHGNAEEDPGHPVVHERVQPANGGVVACDAVAAHDIELA